jgi:hypothetical protein
VAEKMVQVLALVIFMTAIAFWWYRAARQKRHVAVLNAKRPARSNYHCVEIRSGRFACEAVRQLGKTRFLSEEAPRLPLSGCTSQNCTCSYAHFDDRREHDRRNPYGKWASVPPAITGERRARSDRRKSPQSTFKPSIAR